MNQDPASAYNPTPAAAPPTGGQNTAVSGEMSSARRLLGQAGDVAMEGAHIEPPAGTSVPGSPVVTISQPQSTVTQATPDGQVVNVPATAATAAASLSPPDATQKGRQKKSSSKKSSKDSSKDSLESSLSDSDSSQKQNAAQNRSSMSVIVFVVAGILGIIIGLILMFASFGLGILFMGLGILCVSIAIFSPMGRRRNDTSYAE